MLRLLRWGEIFAGAAASTGRVVVTNEDGSVDSTDRRLRSARTSASAPSGSRLASAASTRISTLPPSSGSPQRRRPLGSSGPGTGRPSRPRPRAEGSSGGDIQKPRPRAGRQSCRPKTGVRFCLYGRHADGSTVHRHFADRSGGEALRANPGGRARRREAGARRAPASPSRRWASGGVRRRTRPSRLDPLCPPPGATSSSAGRRSARSTAWSSRSSRRTSGPLCPGHGRGDDDLRQGGVPAGARRRARPERPTTRLSRPRRDTTDRKGVVTAEQVPSHAEALAILVGRPVALPVRCRPRPRLRVPGRRGPRPHAERRRPRRRHGHVSQQAQRRGLVGPKTWRGVRTIESPELDTARAGAGAPGVPTAGASDPRRSRAVSCAGTAGTPRRGVPPSSAPDRPPGATSFHACRHYAVSSMLGEGVPLAEVASYVGDSVETIVKTYAHFIDDAPRTAKRAQTWPSARCPTRPIGWSADATTCGATCGEPLP